MFTLIPAAGSGSRSAATQPKQYALLAGRPMLWHAIRAVCVPPVETVFVVLAPGDTAFAEHDWSAFGDRLEALYCGGESRRDWVYTARLPAQLLADDWVLVHDAARPCLPERDLKALIAACELDEVGGLLALPVADTVKRGSEGRVAKTEDRSALWLAQTPQMFRAGVLMQALQRARGPVTDEAAALEQMGLQPRLVPGSRENLKVTWPEDFAIAEALLRRKS